jgi:hypothetical protein
MLGLLERQVKDSLQLRGAHAAKQDERLKINHQINAIKSTIYILISYYDNLFFTTRQINAAKQHRNFTMRNPGLTR